MESKSEIPLIFITAKTDIESITNGFECGGIDYISKPFNSLELLARVKTHTKLKQQMHLVKEQNKQLNYLNVSKDKFFSIIAHDLRSPISAIMKLAELSLLKSNKLSKNDLENHVKLIYESSKGSFNLLRDLLSWSRVQLGGMKPEKRSVDIQGIVLDTIALFKNYAKQKSIHLYTESPEPLHAYADKNMIETIIRNLCNNALKFTEKNGNVRIDYFPHRNMVNIAVVDDGIGMCEITKKTLFDIDKEKSEVGTEGELGTGLGLLVCKEFAEINGGSISVESKIGKGSSFTLIIPMDKM